jgi:hypothetical protein
VKFPTGTNEANFTGMKKKLKKLCRENLTGKLAENGLALLALWNVCPMKCNASFIGAKPIPLGLGLQLSVMG